MADLHLYIYNEVMTGLEEEIQAELKEVPNPDNIYVHISSPGGGVYTGWTVGNILANQQAKTTALIEGFCASIATYIALSCDEVRIADTAQFMIHNASNQVIGNKNDMEDAAKQLDKIDKDLINKYQLKTGLPKERIAAMMDEETFLNSKEAISMGFADKKMEPIKAVAKFDLKMENEKEVKGLLASIEEKLNNLFKSQPKNEEPQNEEPQNISLELEDGNMIWVRSEDGELEGKEVFMADEEGNPTDTPAPNGTHMLRDGRSITVEDGRVMSVQEAEDKDQIIEDLKAEITALQEQAKADEEAKAAAEAEAVKAQEEVQSQIVALADEVKALKTATVGGSFKQDKPITQPQNKSITNKPSNTGNSGWADALKNRYQ